MKRLLIVVNDPNFFISHRLPIALAARGQGYEVHIATGPGSASEKIKELGFVFHILPLSRSGRNPLREMGSLLALYKLMQRVRPDVVHLVTIKPVLYGGIAARLARVPGVLVAISGMGSTSTASSASGRVLKKIVSKVYKFALGHKNLKIVFQNPVDRDTLLKQGAVEPHQVIMIKGSGVNLSEYVYTKEPSSRPMIVVMAARLLKEKGVEEFVEAAQLLQERNLAVRMVLVGNTDIGNPLTISEEKIREWSKASFVEIWGFRSDIAKIFSEAHIVALPSYYGEGLPKVLIEAAASGRPVITTDHPGCRDAVSSRSGVLIPVRDAVALADAIQGLLVDEEKRNALGRAGRELAEKEFSIEYVVSKHMEAYSDLVSKRA